MNKSSPSDDDGDGPARTKKDGDDDLVRKGSSRSAKLHDALDGHPPDRADDKVDFGVLSNDEDKDGDALMAGPGGGREKAISPSGNASGGGGDNDLAK